MSLISIAVVLVLIGLALWAINSYIPMQSGIKTVLNILVVVVVVLWLLSVFGFIDSAINTHIGKFRIK
jgi:hypothetical protein